VVFSFNFTSSKEVFDYRPGLRPPRRGSPESSSSHHNRYPVVELDRWVLLKASEIRERYGFSFWDSLIVAAALKGEADLLCSEDMQSGFEIDGLRIVNPFEGGERPLT